MKKDQLKSGVLLSYANIAINILLTLTYTPLMLRLLGQQEYGLYNTVSSTITMLSLLNLGFNSGYIRYFSKYKVQNDEAKIEKLNGLFITIFTIIGLITFVLGMILSNNLAFVFETGLTSEEYKTAKTLAVLLTVNLSVSFPMSVFANIINAHEKFVFLKAVSLIKTVLAPLLTLPLLFSGYKSVAIALATICCSLIADIVYVSYTLIQLKCRFRFRGFEKKVFTGLVCYTSFIAINMIVDQINWNIDKILLTRYRGSAEVAVYSVAFTLSTCYTLFSTAVSSVFTPRIHNLVNQTKGSEQKKVLTEIFTKVGRIQFLILGLIATGLILFGKPFLVNYWAGQEYENAYYVVLLLVLPSTIPLIQNLGIEIQRAQNKHYFRSVAYAVMALFNLIASIFLCQKYGAIGAAVGTAISFVVVNGLVMNVFYQKKCNIHIIGFWKEIIYMLKGFVLPIIVGVLLNKVLNMSTFIQFAAAIAIYTVVYAGSVFLLSMNDDEKRFVVNLFKKVKRVKK